MGDAKGFITAMLLFSLPLTFLVTSARCASEFGPVQTSNTELNIKLRPLFAGEEVVFDPEVKNAFITPSMCIPKLFWLKGRNATAVVNAFLLGKEVSWTEVYPLFQDGNWDTAIRGRLSKSNLQPEEMESAVERMTDNLFNHCIIRLSASYAMTEKLTSEMISEAKIRFPLPDQSEDEPSS